MRRSTKIPRILSVEREAGLRLRLEFSDGACGLVDFTEVFSGAPGLLGELIQPRLFNDVRLEDGVLTWPNGVDLDPLVVYCRATGRALTEYFPEADNSILTTPTEHGHAARGRS